MGTHTLTDTLGRSVEMPNQPKRIIGSYLEDYLVALGEAPVAQWTSRQMVRSKIIYKMI